MRKILSMILVFVLCVTLLPAAVHAEVVKGKTGSVDWEYDAQTKTLTISGNGAMDKTFFAAENVPWHAYRGEIESIEMKSGLTYIGNYAFADCVSVESIEIPDTVEEIGRYAFSNMGLTEVVIPNSAKTLGTNLLDGCGKLTTAALPDELEVLPAHIFEHCKELKQVVIPDTVETIGEYAFSYCDALESVAIPSSVTKIGGYAFHSSGIKSIVLPDELKRIESYTFRSCEALKNVYIPRVC